jgi:hypothetical protein
VSLNKPAASNDRERFPSLKEDIGEDPARYLDHDLIERGSRATSTTLQPLVRARIRGIDEIGVVRAWIAVERRLDRGPRESVIELLEERLAYLQEYGEREDRVDLDAVPPAEERVESRTAEDYEAMAELTPKPLSYQLWGSPAERLAERAREESRTEADQNDSGDEERNDPHSDVFDGLADELAESAEETLAADGGESES